MKKVDYLFLIEHEDREGETVKALAEKLRDKGASYIILSIEFHSHLLMFYTPKCVIFPYAIDSQRWPIQYYSNKNIMFVSLNWEQLLSEANKDFKKPKSDLIKNSFYHLCWTIDFQEFLVDAGVCKANTAVLGNPAHEMLNKSLQNRSAIDIYIRKKYAISNNSKIIFFPMNYGWAFSEDHTIKAKIKMGYDKNVAWKYREYSQNCLDKFVDFSIGLAKSEPLTRLIIRPHPSISIEQYLSVFKNKVPMLPGNIIFTKDLTIREWISVSNLIGSSWSTAVWDSLNVGKDAFLFTPITRPAWLNTYWNDQVVNVATVDELIAEKKLTLNSKFQVANIITDVAGWIYNLKASDKITPPSPPEKTRWLIVLGYTIRSSLRCFSMKYLKGYKVAKGMQRDYFKPIGSFIE